MKFKSGYFVRSGVLPGKKPESKKKNPPEREDANKRKTEPGFLAGLPLPEEDELLVNSNIQKRPLPR